MQVQSNYYPLGAVDEYDSMNCCPRPSASVNSSSGHPQYLKGDSFDCCTKRYEIVVYCLPHINITKPIPVGARGRVTVGKITDQYIK